MPKFVPFEEIENLATIEQLAEMLDLKLVGGRTGRCPCPVHGGDDRTLCVTPGVRSKRGSLGVFFCQKAGDGGDRIGLVAHCMEMGQQEAALFIQSQLGTGTVTSTETSTVTVSKDRATKAPEATPPFNPEKFASKLAWAKEVQALGITKSDAERLGIGFHAQRKCVFFPVRNPDGSISGFIGCDEKRGLKLPPQWLAAGNVVRLRA